MIGSRGWTLVVVLSLLAVLAAGLGGDPLPAVRPVPSPVAIVVDAAVVPVSGRVLTDRGTAIRGARVALQQAGCAGCGRTVVRTDAAGGFTARVREGRYRIACTTPAGAPCRVPGCAPLDVATPVVGLRLSVAPVRRAHPR